MVGDDNWEFCYKVELRVSKGYLKFLQKSFVFADIDIKKSILVTHKSTERAEPLVSYIIKY